MTESTKRQVNSVLENDPSRFKLDTYTPPKSAKVPAKPQQSRNEFYDEIDAILDAGMADAEAVEKKLQEQKNASAATTN